MKIKAPGEEKEKLFLDFASSTDQGKKTQFCGETCWFQKNAQNLVEAIKENFSGP